MRFLKKTKIWGKAFILKRPWRRQESHQSRAGWWDWENGVWNDLNDGWQSEASKPVGAEFDGQPLGFQSAELYTILFSCLNTGTHCRWRGRDESSECVRVCVCASSSQMLQLGPGMGPEEVQNILWVDSIKWRVQETKRQSGKETMCTSLDQHWAVGDCRSSNCNSPEIDSQPCAHFCISLPLCKRIKGTFKERQRDWPGACRVPFLTTGGPGQIKSARAAQPALLPAFAFCAVY